MSVKAISCMVLFVVAACFLEASVVVKVDFEEFAGDADGYITNGDIVLDSTADLSNYQTEAYDGFWGGRIYGDSEDAPLATGANGGVAVDTSDNDMFVYLRDAKAFTTGDGVTRPVSYTTQSPYFTLEATKSYTFEALVKWDADSTDAPRGIMGQIGTNEFWLRENDGYLQWAMKSDDGAVNATRADNPAALNIRSLTTDDQWHHIALVLDRSVGQVRAYADGVLLYTDTNPAIAQLGEMLDGTVDFCLGAYRTDSDLAYTRFDGLQDAYVISDEALAPDSFVIPEPVSAAMPSVGATDVLLESSLSWMVSSDVLSSTLYLGQRPRADLSGNDIVDIEDLSMLVASYLDPSFAALDAADITHDLAIDLGDFALMAQQWQSQTVLTQIQTFTNDGLNGPFIYIPAAALDADTEYLWRVDATTAEETVTGDLWSFKTKPQGSFFEETHLFVSGSEGYAYYRIPSIITAPNGDLLAFCEGRKTSMNDFGDIDIVMKRSTDNGSTWGSLELIYEEGGNALITIGNPCPVVDESNGRIWMPFCRNNSRVYVGYSDDNGYTWSDRREVTSAVKAADWTWYATGPGVGIQLKRGLYNGRLVIPSDHKAGEQGSHMMYSDDHGVTWTYSERILPGCNECQAVELVDGTVMNNARTYSVNPDYRGISTSEDGGQTWSELWFDTELPEPTCQASFLRYTFADENGRNRILFSNPNSTSDRVNLTVRLSYDEAETWPVSRQIYAGASAYSCLVVVPDQSIGCLYERDDYTKITFAHFSLEWLTDGTDTLRLSGD